MATTFRTKMNYPNGSGTLAAGIDDNDLTITLTAGHTVTGTTNFTISIDEEIILIDSRSTNTLTVNASGRGYDSSTASAHATSAAVYNYQIVKDFTDLETAVNGIENGTTTLASLTTTGAVTCGGDLAVNGATSADITSTTTTASLFNATVTTLSIGGAATTLSAGAGAASTANLNFTTAVNLNTAAIASNQTTVALLNATATTVNAFGAATTLNLGAATGTTTIAGTLQVTKNADAGHAMIIDNQNGGTAAFARYEARNGAAEADAMKMLCMGTAWTTTGAFVQDGGVLEAGANLAGGLSIMARHSSGVIRFYSGGAAAGDLALTLDTSADATLVGNLAVNGGDITTTDTTGNVFTAPTTVNAFTGASTALNIGHASGTNSIAGATTFTDNVTLGNASTDSITTTGYMVKHHTYGSMYCAGNADALTLTNQNTWYQFVEFDAAGASRNTTVSHANDDITILEAGDYLVTLACSFSGSVSSSFECQIFKNNGATAFTNLHFERLLGTGGDIGSASISGIAAGLEVNDTVEFWVQCTSAAGKTFTGRDVTLTVVKL